MTNSTAPQTTAPSANRSGGIWILGIGAVALISHIGYRLDTQVAAGLAMCIPMAFAVAAMVRSRREHGQVSASSLWFAFGASFPAVLGIARIVGVEAATAAPLIFPVGFLVIGALTVLGRVGHGCGRDQRRSTRVTEPTAQGGYAAPGHVGTD